MPSWLTGSPWPESWTVISFSPIIVSDNYYMVHVGGHSLVKFYLYNIGLSTWKALADPPAAIVYSLSMSPDNTKLATNALNGRVLFIYSITDDSWVSSSNSPLMDDADTPSIKNTVWADNDTIWVYVTATPDGGATFNVKCYKYTVSTDVWTQFTNYITPTAPQGQGMGISPDLTTLYFGQCGDTYRSASKYVISTDTYTINAITIDSTYYFTYTSDGNRLWHGTRPQNGLYRYIDLSDESIVTEVFPTNASADKPSNITAGIYNAKTAIVHCGTNEPKNWHYTFVDLRREAKANIGEVLHSSNSNLLH